MINPIVIVARNALHLTKKAVASAVAQDIGDVRVVLIDNCCDDDTRRWWAAQPLENPGVLCYQKQVSLAKCWNDALTVMLHLSDHCLVMNNDIEIRPDMYRLLLTDGNEFVSGVSVDSVDAMNAPYRNYSQSPHPDFSCFLIHKAVVEKVGWFNEEYYPAYFEDNDYHVRMHRARVRAISINVPFLHHASGTLKHANPKDKEVIERGFARNKERFKETYGCYPDSPEYQKLFV